MSELWEAARVKPKTTSNACVIWLHGLGADGYDFVDVIPNLRLPADHGIEFIFPHAPQMPVTLNGGYVMPAWFDIIAIDANAPQDEAGLKKGAQSLQQLITSINKENIPASRIIVMGFSQGGALALYTALRSDLPLAGVAGLSTYLPMANKLPGERSPQNDQIRIFMAHGLMDPVVPYWMGQKACSFLMEQGYQVQWHDYPMLHTVCYPELEEIGKWIKTILL